MNNLFICSTRYLKIKETDFDFNLGFSKFSNKDSFLINTFKNQNLIMNFGVNNLPPLESTPFFYDIIDDKLSTEVRTRNSEKKLEYFQMIISNLWFIRDCSCNTRKYLDISIDKNIYFSRMRTTFFCNSKGQYIEQIFTIKEILKSIEITNKIIDLQNNEIQDEVLSKKPNQSLGNITPSDHNYLRYHDTNRIQRAIIFLTLARSNSFLPLKISFYIGILETLFTTDNSEVTHKVSERISFYLKDNFDKYQTFKTIKECYGIRSKFVHGQTLHKKYTNGKLSEISSQIDNIIRILLNRIVIYDFEIFKKNSGELNEYLNNMIFK